MEKRISPVKKIRETTSPQFAYYRSIDRDLFLRFIEKAILKFKSCTLSVHVEYVFFSASNNEFVRTHSSPLRYNFDEDDIVVDSDRINSILDETEEIAENQLTGSGYTISDTVAYYVNILPYCIVPGGVKISTKNTMNVKDRRKKLLPLASTSQFICTLACGFLHKNNLINKQRVSEADVHRFVKRFKLHAYCDRDINLSNIANIHHKMDDFNLIIFNIRGHIIYRKCYEADNEEDELDINNYITLLWKENKWYYVKSIASIFQFHRKHKNINAEFCIQCGYFHLNPESCVSPPADIAEFYLPKKPEYPRHLVGYADFEAYIDKDSKEHILSGYSIVYTKRKNDQVKIYAHKVTNLYTEGLEEYEPEDASYQLMSNFFKDITVYIEDYNIGIDVDIAPICKVTWAEFHSSSHYTFKSYNTTKTVTYCAYHLARSEEKLIIYFHNFKGYDSNFIIQFAIANDYECKVFTRRAAKVDQFLITSKENPFIRFEFRDSYNHLSSPLSSLSATINDWLNIPQKYLKAFQKNKGPFPYLWFDDPLKLIDPIPEREEDWFNELTQQTIDGWEDAIDYFNRYFKYFWEYHDFYNLLDTYILCAVFEQYRTTVLSEDKVDPTYLFGAPSLSLYSAVSQAPDKYKSPPTTAIYKLFQNHIRGGVSQVMYRYLNIQNKPNDYIKYMDINALYSSCMTEKLPTELIQFFDGYWDRNGTSYGTDDYISFYYVNKIIYPKELHDIEVHFQYPLVPHRYQNKLCTTFLDKEKYLIHEDNYKFYKEKGVIFEDIISTYIFKQEYVMKDYIISNITKRNDPNTPKPIKDLCKLKNNALYGKTCENVWKYKEIKIDKIPEGSSEEEIRDWTRKFKRAREIQYITESKVIYGEPYRRIKLCKPIQLGFSILEKAKLRVYKFIYKLFECYPGQIQLLYTDTDSLIIHFKNFNKDPYIDMQFTMKEYIDVPYVDNEFLPPTKDLGLWSDDSGYRKIIKFCGLRAKSYAILFDDDSETIKNKGVIKYATINDQFVSFKHYRDALIQDQKIYASQYIIKRKYRSYILQNYHQRKLAINTYDSKHMYAKDKRTAVPFGYKGNKYDTLYYIVHDSIRENKIHF